MSDISGAWLDSNLDH